MADRIIHKRSLTANSIPLTSSLALGEIALNVNDGKLFFRQSGSSGDITVSPLMTAQTSSMLQPYVLSSNTSSFVTNSQTSSFVFNSVTSSMLSSYVLNSSTSSMLDPYTLNSVTASMLTPYVLTSVTSSMTVLSSSFATTALMAPDYLPLTGGTISGNLTIIGTASFNYVSSSIITAGTSVIILNTNNPAIRFGGISVVDSGSFGVSSTGSLFWDSTNNRWIYSNPSGSTYDGGMLISGPRNTSGLGNEAGMDANFIAVGQGADHIRPGSIYNSGSITIVTGSLTVTEGVSGSFTGSLTGALIGTASYATEALTAPNYVLTSVTSSMSVATASYVRLSISSSYPISAAGSSIYSITPAGTSTGTNNTILLGANAGSGGTSIYNSNFIGYGAGNAATIANQSNTRARAFRCY